jgi:FlaA1/EpsC-like NDP-sugar epimerase
MTIIVSGDIEITCTELRSGEKLYEKLLIGSNVMPTQHELIMSAEEDSLLWAEIEVFLKRFSDAVDGNDVQKSQSLLLEAVSGYLPQCDVADLIYERNRQSKGNGNILDPKKQLGVKTK